MWFARRPNDCTAEVGGLQNIFHVGRGNKKSQNRWSKQLSHLLFSI